MRKLTRHDAGRLYAMKVLNKITVVQKRKTAEHTKTERVVSKMYRKEKWSKQIKKEKKIYPYDDTIRAQIKPFTFAIASFTLAI